MEVKIERSRGGEHGLVVGEAGGCERRKEELQLGLVAVEVERGNWRCGGVWIEKCRVQR